MSTLNLSTEADILQAKMLEELSSLGYGYRKTVEGCFDYCIKRYGMKTPIEDKSLIVNNVLSILNNH